MGAPPNVAERTGKLLKLRVGRFRESSFSIANPHGSVLLLAVEQRDSRHTTSGALA